MIYSGKTIRIIEYFTVFLSGALVYFLAEILYRGYSHITMFFAGGICFYLIYMCEKYISETRLIYRCVLYAFVITAVEFVFGIVFNIWLGFDVWDYSEEPFNILGQICPGFMIMWLGLSVPAVWISGKIRNLFVKLSKT